MINKFAICKLALSIGLILSVNACNQSPTQPVIVDSKLSNDNLESARNFLNTNKSKLGVVTTKSGLQYQILESGPEDGKMPNATSLVRVNYEGKLLNGKIFDSSYARGQAAEFPVDGLIPAWVEALQLMHEGDEWMIYVPPELGYGSDGAPQGCAMMGIECTIGPNSLLIFRMKLEKIIEPSAIMGSDLGIDENPNANGGDAKIH